MRVRRRMLTVVFLAIVVGVVFFPDWERWSGKSDGALMQAVVGGASGEAFGIEVERRSEESAEFRALMREWYFMVVETGDEEARGRVWMWDGVIWGEGELAGAIEGRMGEVEDGGARGRLLGAYLDGGGENVAFLVGLLGDEAVGGIAARWLVEHEGVPEGEKRNVVGSLVGEVDAGLRGAMAAFYADGVLEPGAYAGWLERVISVVENGDGSCCPGGREERDRLLGELEGELARLENRDKR